MPVSHIQIQAAKQGPDGKQIPVSAATALRDLGPMIQVTLSLESNAEKGLLAEGKPVPTPISGMALIDTGAMRTCIDDATAQKLGLPVIGVGRMSSATHANEPCNIYPVKFVIQSIGAVNLPNTMGAKLGGHIVALIGRDLLASCVLVYNGVSGQVTLCR